MIVSNSCHSAFSLRPQSGCWFAAILLATAINAACAVTGVCQENAPATTDTSLRATVEAAQLPAPAPANQDYRYWQTNWSFNDIDIGNLQRRLSQVGIEIPIQTAGDVSINFSVSVPINALRTGRAYKFSGTLSSNQLQLEQLRLTNLTTQISYQNGRLKFTNLSMRWIDGRQPSPTSAAGTLPAPATANSAGTLAGDATFQLIPLENFAANLQAKSLSIAPAFDLITELSNDADTNILAGSLTGAISVRGPLTDFGNINNWTVNANMRGQNLTFGESTPLTIATGMVRLDNARFTANDIRLGSPVDDSIRLAASVDATLQETLPFEFTLRGDDVPLPTLASLGSLQTEVPVAGKLDVDLSGSGQLAPATSQPTWSITGRLASPSLSVYGFNLGLIEHSITFDDQRFELISLREQPIRDKLLQRIAARYDINSTAIELDSLEAEVFAGSINGEAVFSRDDAGTHRVDLEWQEIQPRVNTAAFLPASVDVSLRTSGMVSWQVPANSIDQLATHQGTASIVIDPIALNQTSIGDLQAEISVGQGELSLNGSGNLFGGTFEVDTVAPLALGKPSIKQLARVKYPLNLKHYVSKSDTFLSEQPWRTDLETYDWFQTQTCVQKNSFLSNLNLRFQSINVRNIQALLTPSAQPLSGRLSGILHLTNLNPVQADVQLTGSGFRLGRTPIASRFDSTMTLVDKQLQISSLRGNYAGGRFEVVGGLNISDFRGRLNARLEAIDFSRGTVLISNALSNLVGGSLSARATIDLQRTINIQGVVKVRDNQIFEFGTGATHANAKIVLSKQLDSWSVKFRNIHGILGRGRIEGDLKLTSSSVRRGAFDMESQWQAKRLDFTSLLADFGSQTKYARGELDGSITLGGNGIRSVADLRGRFDAKLGGTQARAVPGLLSTQTYLGAFSMAGTAFDAGRVRGNIGAGVIDLTELWLISDQVNVWADGRIRIPSGRLNIAAVVQTGDFEAQNLALLTLAEAVTIPVGIPLGAIIRINRLASDRTLYFDVVGQLPRPRVRLRPLDVFRENAAQYLLREAASTVIPFSTPSAILPFDQND